MNETRKIAAIVVADVVGFSRLMGADEDRTLARLRSLRSDLIDPTIAAHHGRVVKRTGDGAIVEFRSVIDAVRCAIEVQSGMLERNAGLPPDRRIEFRIGIHLGDVVEESDGDLMGDGVNIAARLEGICEVGGVCISEDAYRQVRDKIKGSFVDLGEQVLKNIARPMRAYQVKRDPHETKPEAAATEGPSGQLALPNKPSIAVLPFANMSGDPEQDFFADGLVDDIVTTLSKLAGLRVIARNSSFVYKGRAVDVREAAKQLGVRYILEGGVRKSANRVRITAQLIDAGTGSHLWAERYDRSIDDIFAVQDEITLVLATEMQVRLTEGEQARLRYTTTNNIEAWTHWVQGVSYYRQPVTKENIAAALACWTRALALDPNSASLNAMVGYCYVVDARFGWRDEQEAALAEARAYIDRALELDPENADANTMLAFVRLLEGRYGEAKFHMWRALDLAPGSADVVSLACFILASSGYPGEAVVHGERAMTLSPNYPSYYLGILGNAYRLSGRTEEAISAFKAFSARSPGFGLSDLVILYQRSGRTDEAKRAAEQLLSLRRDFTIDAWAGTQFRADKEDFHADIAALRAAGLR